MRLLVWNIKFFSLNRIAEPSPGRMKSVESAWRSSHILDHIGGGNPDMFILIENRSSQGKLGSLAGGNGAEGALLLLKYLRAMQDDQDWRLVPPQKLVQAPDLADQLQYTEVISVYFKNSVFDFRGPYVWPEADPAAGAKVAVPAGATTEAYPDPWSSCLPAGNHYAGQAQFFKPAADGGGELRFGGNPGEGVYKRKPFLTKFRERGGTNRDFTIVTSHPSPGVDSQTSTASLPSIRELADVADNEVMVLCGDFNINVQDPSVLDGAVLGLLRMCHFSHPRIAAANGPTIVKNVGTATPESYLGTGLLDNFFLRYGATARPAALPTGSIVNMVTGTADYPSDMNATLAALQGHTDTFRELRNYGHIGYAPGTSDHLGVSIDL